MSASPQDKKKASVLRAKVRNGKTLSYDEQTWLGQYERAHSKLATIVPPARPVPGERNRSASEKITYTEERAAAEGNHVHPDAYGNMVRAEGLRADTLLRIVADALVRVNDQYYRMSEHLLARLTVIEESHVDMLEAIRDSHLARTEAEAAAIAARAGDEGGEFMRLMRMGVEMKKLRGEGKPEKRAPARKKRERPLGEVP